MDAVERTKAWYQSLPEARQNSLTDEDIQRKVDFFKKMNTKKRDVGFTEAVFPRTVKASRAGSNFPLASAIGDVVSYPARALTSLASLSDDNQTMNQRMAELERPDAGSFSGNLIGGIENIVRDPLTIPSALTGGVGINAVRGVLPKLLAGASKNPAKELVARAGLNMAEQVPYSLAEREMLKEQGVKTGGMGLELGLAGALGASNPFMAKTAKSAGDLAKKTLSQLTQKSEDLLETVGGREIKQAVKGAFGGKPDEQLQKITGKAQKTEEIVDDVIRYFDGFETNYRKENEIIDDAVKNMGSFNPYDLVNKMQSLKLDKRGSRSKTPIPFGHSHESKISGTYDYQNRYNREIDRAIEQTQDFISKKTNPNVIAGRDPSKITSGGPQPTNEIDANDLLELRRRIDASINFQKKPSDVGETRMLEDVNKKIRTMMKGDLEKRALATGNKQYITAMNRYAKLLDTRDRITNKITGKDNNADKVKNFLVSMGNPDRLENKKLARDVKTMLGPELFDKARILRLAREYNDGLSIFSDINTGASAKIANYLPPQAKMLGAMAQSPKLVAPAYSAVGGLQRMAESIPLSMQKTTPLMLKNLAEDEE